MKNVFCPQFTVTRKVRNQGLRIGIPMYALLFALLQFSGVASAENPTLNDISYSTLPGERIQIKLHMSEPPAEPGSFTIDNPARIALDFPNTRSGLAKKSENIGVGAVRSVAAIEAGGRTRVVINLTHPTGYQTKIAGNDVIVTLGSDAAPVETPSVAAKPSAIKPATTGQAVHNVDFRRGEKGEGRVVITLADPNTPVDMQKRGRQILVNIPRSELPSDLERRMDVIDFATPVSSVDAFTQGGNTRLVLRMNQDFDHIAYQADNRFTIDVRPLIKESEEARKKKRRKKEYTGERLSLNFQNIEVRAVLQLIADFTGLNLVTSDTVDGNLTLRLKNVPWDQALDIILKTKGLGKRQTGNVILVAPAEEIAAREKLELEATKQIKQLVPLENANIQVNYAKASDLASLVSGKGGGSASNKTNKLLSERGSVSVDERTNTLLVQDIPEHIEQIISLVEELDIAVRQVLVESRVVLASNDFSKELGVRFGVSRSTQSGSSDVGASGNLVGADQARSGVIPGISDRLNVDLPAANIANAGTIGLAVARLPFGTLLDLELSAAQAEGRSETVSSPRVITSNQHEALIETGQEIPYLERASSGAATVAFKKAVLALRVTPQITPDDRIIMNLQVNKDEADFSRSVLGVPPINTQEVQTQVLVNNGETVVLGGVYEVLKTEQIQRVPFFGDLPVVGALFRTKFESSEKDELLIFVTPKILKQDLAL